MEILMILMNLKDGELLEFHLTALVPIIMVQDMVQQSLEKHHLDLNNTIQHSKSFWMVNFMTVAT